MTARGGRRAAAGLTLIELVLTVTILAVAGAIVAESFGTALGTWRRSFELGRAELASRIVAARIAEQLRSALQTYTEKSGTEAVAFEAGEGMVRFVTSLSSRAPAPTAVSYRMTEEDGRPALAYREHAWPDKEFFKDPPAQREELVPEVTAFAVSVTARADEDAGPNAVADEWRPEDGVLPAAVTVTVTTAGPEGGEGRTATIVVALPAEGLP